jgi:iron complex outermembrane receptor protein
MNARLVASLGEWDFARFFGVLNLGEFGPLGTRAWISASKADNRVPYNNYGQIDKQQYNAKIWQPVGTNGDFVSIGFHYNQNRNNFFGSAPLRNDTTQSATDSRPRNPGTLSTQRYPGTRSERFYELNYPCVVDTPQAGVADAPTASTLDAASCGTEFDRRFNPSNTGNFRGASRFTLADGIVLTVDPSYQFVKANGGGTVTGNEGAVRDINPGDPPGTAEGATATPAQCRTGNTVFRTCVAGYLGGTPFFGVDLNGDGDTLDTVTVLAPSQTRTKRPGVIAGVRWDINPQHTVRVGYTLDHARHRQTGEVGHVNRGGDPFDVFPINDPLADHLGVNLQKRDRLSYAILNQFSGEYRGEFGPVTVNVGLRAPFFVRRLRNYCFTSSASGFVECFGQQPDREAQFATLNPTIQGPQKRTFKYDELLPNLGAIYDITDQMSLFASYTKGLSVPSTDNLYNSFFFAPDTDEARPKPETTDSFDGGFRYRSGQIQAQLSGWFTKFNDRTASAFDPELNQSVFRNLGRVDKYGIDGSVAYEPMRELTLYVFGSWNKSKIKDNIQTGALPVGESCDTIDEDSINGLRNCAFTAGRPESGSPKYTYGLSAIGKLGPLDLGATAKRTGPRFIFDNGASMFRGDIGVTTTTPGRVVQEQIFGNKAPAYWLVNLDARYNLSHWSRRLSKTYIQANVYNLFDKFYVGGFGGGLAQSVSTRTCNATSTPSCVPTVTVPTWGSPPFVQIGAPRTLSFTLNVGL